MADPVITVTEGAASQYADGGDTVSSDVLNAFVVQLGAALDVIVAPAAYIQVPSNTTEGQARTASWSFPTRLVSDNRTATIVGIHAVPQDMQLLNPNDQTITAQERERRTMALASYRVISQVSASVSAAAQQPSQTQEQPASAIPFIAIAVVVGVVALAAWVGSRVDVSIAAQQRRTQLSVASAANAYAERLRVFRETGTMPPPSEAETAAAEAVRSEAQNAWAQLARELPRVGERVGNTALYVGGGLLLAYMVFGGKKT